MNALSIWQRNDRPTVNSQYSTFTKADGISAARLCLLFYLLMLLLSITYVFVTRELNGDFLGVPLSISFLDFGLVSVMSLAPYLVGYQIYKWFTRSAPAPNVNVSNSMLGITFFAVTLWFIFLAVQYGVGVLGTNIFEPPPGFLQLVIQITNRINPFYLGAFFIVGYQGSKKTVGVGILLLVTLGLLRAGLGVFVYVLLALIIRNHKIFLEGLRRHFFKFVLALGIIPVAASGISQLYELRSELRDTQSLTSDLSGTEVVAGRLAGRLSSVSNTAFIFQTSNLFQSYARTLDPWYFQRQALAPLFGVGIVPENTPERLLINAEGGNLFDVSFMTGVPGNLMLSWFINPLVTLTNIVTIILTVWLSFFFANRLNIPYRNEVCFMLTLYPLTSGVANEFTFIPVTMFALIILFSVIKLFKI